MSLDALAGLMLAYAVFLLAAAWIAERLPAPREGRRTTGSPWARTEATRFRKGMARVVRVVAVFLILAVLVRLHASAWLWPALVVLCFVAVIEALSASSATGVRAQRKEPAGARVGPRSEPVGEEGRQTGGGGLGDDALTR